MTNHGNLNCDPCQDLAGALSAMFNQSLRLGIGFLERLGRTGESILRGQAGCGSGCGCAGPMKGFGLRRLGRSCCEIPPPCWMPLHLGSLTSHVCPGATATIRLRISNCGVNPQNFKIELAGKPEDVKNGKAVPDTFPVKSMEHEFVAVSFAMPADAHVGSCKEVLVWVRGCKNYYLRWTISASAFGPDSCHEVCVEDCPDTLHRWSDHFYCNHPCPGGTH